MQVFVGGVLCMCGGVLTRKKVVVLAGPTKAGR